MTAPENETYRAFVCPWCDSPATYCAAQKHGTANGPAMHCQRSPAHNEFNPDGFPRWDATAERSTA